MTFHTTGFKADLLAAVPRLRAFAIGIAGRELADDLVQETILKAWANAARYQDATNFTGWLYTILRNCYLNQWRKQRREVQDYGGAYTNSLVQEHNQEHALHLADLEKAMACLNGNQRQALMLVAAEGLSYEETALICKCSVGAVKSRVHRGRLHLAILMKTQVEQSKHIKKECRRTA
jgi:RNA polymerase sigma-70 factor, ECF subfamily